MNVIAFDADDTMWHHEPLFQMTQKKFVELLSKYCEQDHINTKLDAAVLGNLKTYGYGIKSFVLSMIESATELTEGRIYGGKFPQIRCVACCRNRRNWRSYTLSSFTVS